MKTTNTTLESSKQTSSPRDRLALRTSLRAGEVSIPSKKQKNPG